MKVFVIIDGVGDLSIPELGNKTPLEAANKPNMDWFAANGKSGHVFTIREGFAPESDGAVVALLGNDAEKVYTGRGPLEAFGAGVIFKNGDLALRTNFATVDGRTVADRRAGRGLTTEEAKVFEKDINSKVKLRFPFTFKSTVQHRGVLVIHGEFSDEISNVDPAYTKLGKIGVVNERQGKELLPCKPLDDSEIARESADTVNDFVEQCLKVLAEHPLNKKRVEEGMLPANALLLRDAGVRLPKLAARKGWAAVMSMPLEIGLSKLCGMKVIKFDYPEMKVRDVYANLHAGLEKTISESRKAIEEKAANHFYIHFKETDVAGHDGNYKEKMRMVEIIDREFFGFLRGIKNLQLVVTGDHSTPCVKKNHSSDPLPLLWYGDGKDGVKAYSERACMKGSMGKLCGKDVLKRCGF